MTTTKTYRLRERDMERGWHVLDAEARPLGRLATEVASLLLGKHKPTYEPHLAMGDFVVVVNASKVAVTGRKSLQKIYYRHSGYPGGLRERTLEQQLARDPRRVVERAVRGMLPHNSRGRELFRHLKVYDGPEHPHEAQFAAGTGARARRRLARGDEQPRRKRRTGAAVSESPTTAAPEPIVAEMAAPADPPVEAPAVPAEAVAEAPSGALSRWKRGELDAEAERVGIAIESDWKKQDVIDAIEAHRAAAAGAAEQDG
jgi:large subunit ribosomal protein L13